MARPSKAGEQELERLEALAALVADSILSERVAAIRVEQVLRRIRGNRELEKVVGPLREELERIAENTADMRKLLSEILEVKQRERTEANGGTGD